MGLILFRLLVTESYILGGNLSISKSNSMICLGWNFLSDDNIRWINNIYSKKPDTIQLSMLYV